MIIFRRLFLIVLATYIGYRITGNIHYTLVMMGCILAGPLVFMLMRATIWSMFGHNDITIGQFIYGFHWKPETTIDEDEHVKKDYVDEQITKQAKLNRGGFIPE